MSLLCDRPAAGQTIEFPTAEAPTVDFAKQIIPLLTKAGCNAGACHGAAAGRGYLGLSLYGSHPEKDYETLLFLPAGRFVDTQAAERSLMLQKPGGYLDHGGGTPLDGQDREVQMLLTWLRQGAPRGSMSELTDLEIRPAPSIECQVGDTIRLQAIATWNDGHQASVSDWLWVDGAQPMNATDVSVGYRHQTDSAGEPSLLLTPHGGWLLADNTPLWCRRSQSATVGTIGVQRRVACFVDATGDHRCPSGRWRSAHRQGRWQVPAHRMCWLDGCGSIYSGAIPTTKNGRPQRPS